jgi:hypothetical protein
MSDLQRLMRAVKIIARLAQKYDQKDVADALMKHCSRRDRDVAAFIRQYFVDVFDLNRKAEEEAEPRCCECGGNVFNAKNFNRQIAEILGVSPQTIDHDCGTKVRTVRADTRYCSPKCRQRAYRKRKRVTVRHSSSRRKRHAATIGDASRGAHAGQAVTPEMRATS